MFPCFRSREQIGILLLIIASTNFLLAPSDLNHEVTRPQFGKTNVTINQNHNVPKSNRFSRTKILGFADYNYREYALRWYQRLSDLGYSEQVVVAVDDAAVDFFRKHKAQIRWEELPYKPCTTWNEDSRIYRRQIFGRRWKYVYDQLLKGHSVLITDVDNVFRRNFALQNLEQSEYDVFHAYSTSYPTHVFEEMGFTVCGGLSWLRDDSKVKRFVRSLVNRCNCLELQPDKPDTSDELCKKCYCDDQIALNEMLWKGKHKVNWDHEMSKPANLSDFPFEGLTGVSSTTKHRIKVWDRSFAYRAKMPNVCPIDNWVAMPLYVDRADVVQVWSALCGD
ncbi:unnamed protein product [Cylindrotheca closterium]|uniref:Nucleotide-diphospho-sugar transferase domain-containing protein n=1 Tax=Cylindrotheca closterium TaxID=2856 RepID=A0AAD2PVT9_9STRA|nr:unnamed protein product [Cylindrotheca closterium]